MSEPNAWSIEGLLGHEPFVRAVVRGILADEGSVQDVLQETWLRVLRRRPSGSSPRSWLARVAKNLALDSRRGVLRRERREREVARPESSMAADAARERLSAHRALVDAVLNLAEPYRSVVLLRYFDELDPAEISARLGRSSATVRSQLSRAHVILRRALEADLDGGRSAWSVLIVPAASAPMSAFAKAGAAVLAIGALGMLVLPKLMGTGGPPPEPARFSPVTLAPPSSSPSVATGLASPVGTVVPSARTVVETQSSTDRLPALEDIQSLSMQELFELAVQTQRAIEERLLLPDESLVREHADFLSAAGTGIARLLYRTGADGDYEQVTTKRGGGSFFSFETRDHSYDAEPDLCLFATDGGAQRETLTGDERTSGRVSRASAFQAGFYGIQLGFMLDIGDVELADLPMRALPLPAWLPGEREEAWRILWSELDLDDAQHGSELRARTKDLQRAIPCPEAPSTFLLRAFSPGEHDLLVAFRPVARDDRGCTLLWRILASWPIPGGKGGSSARFDEHLEVPQGPRWLEEMELPELFALLNSIRDLARGPLFDVPTSVQDRYRAVLGEGHSFAERSGFARILHRFRWDPLVEERGEGAFYSFLTGSNSFDERSELKLEQDRYDSGFAGNDAGLMLDLGSLPFDQLARVLGGERPAQLSSREQEAWDFLWSVRASVGMDGRRALSFADSARAAELGLTRGVPAIVGHTYLLRSVLFSSHDHLVVFTTVDGDEYGHSLAWRILRSWPVEQGH